MAGTEGSSSVHKTSLPAGRRARVTPLATISKSQRSGAPSFKAWRARWAKPGDMTMSQAISGMPQAWMMRTATGSSAALKRARSNSARMIAKDRR